MKTYVKNRRTKNACAQRRVTLGKRDPFASLNAHLAKLCKSLSLFVTDAMKIQLKPWQRKILDDPIPVVALPKIPRGQMVFLRDKRRRAMAAYPESKFYFDESLISKGPHV